MFADPTVLDSARLIFDLQKVNAVIQRISGCVDPKVIAQNVTEALVTEFDCAFTRIWLTETDGQGLRLVASSGLYTRTNGSFAWVPMGAYKVGKIAQNRVPFLSNHLAEETWVKDREWAVANKIYGFAGYPLVMREQVIGVLAAFSHRPFLPEFLEVLQVLCMAVTTALDYALQEQQKHHAPHPAGLLNHEVCLSDFLSGILTATNLTLVGTEQTLTPGLAYLLLRTTEILNQLDCSYCRLTYGARWVSLEGIVATSGLKDQRGQGWEEFCFGDIDFFATYLGGRLQTQLSPQQQVLQMSLQLPYPHCEVKPQPENKLSQREQQVMVLLTQGLRDRDIAQKLYISESTVKFHINSAMSKLKAKNRYQAIYQATIRGLI